MPDIVVAARACIINQNKLLLVSNDGSYWYLPGGHVEPGENLTECVKREIYEETGYKIDIQDMIYVFEFFDKSISSHKVEIVFQATLNSPSEKHEWQDLGQNQSVTMKQWFTLEEINSMKNIRPQFIKNGEWILKRSNSLYKGYEESECSLA